MTTLLIKEEEKHILEVLPILLKSDREFKSSLYTILRETFLTKEEAHVTREDFSELKGIVQELAQAQKRTEIRVEELAQAQKRTEIRVEELAQAQKESQKEIGRLDRIMQELAQAQKKTEDELRLLTRTVKNVQKELGGISNTIGYDLEDKYIAVFDGILKEDFGFEIANRLERRYIEYPNGKDDEINLYGEGRLNGKEVCLVGESKAQIGKGDVDKFIKLIDRVQAYLKKDILPILLCYSIHPKVERYIEEKGSRIKVYKSSELAQRVR